MKKYSGRMLVTSKVLLVLGFVMWTSSLSLVSISWMMVLPWYMEPLPIEK